MRRVWITLTILFILLFALACYIGMVGGNVRVVEAGRVYRSSQLTGNEAVAMSARLLGNSLENVLETDHIQTVINLRGGSPADARYRDEVAVCRRLGVDHIDIPFSARHLPPPETLQKLLDTFDHARYPLVIHCQAGSDRTGLACTLYETLYGPHLPLDTAEAQQLTWHYGHFPIGPTRAMDDFFTLYRQTGHGMDLRAWITQQYPALYAHSPERITPESSSPSASTMR